MTKTTYTIKDGTDIKHWTTDPDAAELYSKAGYVVYAETEG